MVESSCCLPHYTTFHLRTASWDVMTEFRFTAVHYALPNDINEPSYQNKRGKETELQQLKAAGAPLLWKACCDD